jgi:hypothetical protein
LHPNQYETKLLEEINFPIVPINIRAVAAAIECETGGTTAMHDKLGRRKADRNALLSLSLTPSENSLASEFT